MDQASRERRFVRCSQLWSAATNRRRYRTHQQDKQAQRNRIKATALTTVAETLLITATLAAGLAMFRLTASIPDAAVVLAITVAFGVNNILTPLVTATFGPTIDRLNGLDTDDTNTETAR